MPLSAETPTRQPARAGSLNATVTWIEGVDRLLDTVTFMPDLCVAGGLFDPCSPGTKAITAQDGPTTVPVHGVWEGATCTTGSSTDEISLTGERAARALNISLSAKVEEALWTGGVYAPITDGSALASTAADDITAGGPIGVVPAISQMVAALDAVLGGARGIIHVPQFLVPYLTFYGLVARNGNILQVANTDHVYVAGVGYPGTDPDGNDPVAGETWIYGTGPVNALISDVLIPDPAIDRSVNQLEVRAERAVAAFFSPCAHIGANVCLPDPGPDCVVS